MQHIDSKLSHKSRNWKKHLSFVIKLSLTLIVLCLVLSPIPLQEYRRVWVLCTIQTIASVFALVLAQISLLAFRWYLLARSAGSRLSLTTSIFGILMSFFFSQGLPASVGGDAFRLWWHRREGISTGIAFKIIFFDRVYGLFSLILLCGLSFFLLMYLMGDFEKLSSLILLIVAMGSILGLLIMPWRIGISKKIERLSLYFPKFFANTLLWFLSTRNALSKEKLSTTLGLLATGLMTHLLVVAQVYVIGYALSPDKINILICLAAVPPALLVSYMPFSIAGWGVREASMVIAFGLLGIGATTAILISLTIGMAILFISLLGALLWITGGFRAAYVEIKN